MSRPYAELDSQETQESQESTAAGEGGSDNSVEILTCDGVLVGKIESSIVDQLLDNNVIKNFTKNANMEELIDIKPKVTEQYMNTEDIDLEAAESSDLTINL